VVDGILEDAWDRTIVFGSYEQQTLRGYDLSLEPFDLARLVGIVILIVERKIVDLGAPEGEVNRCKLRDPFGKRVKRIAA
jgi:hypothetical protein